MLSAKEWMKQPYLSVVVTSRNDNHGGDMLKRMQIMVSAFLEQCRRHNLSSELIIVEWNPPQGPRLKDVLDINTENSLCEVCFVEVPAAIHNQLPNADKLPLFQMIAKNVGIRRARGKFVLATNIDIIFNDELMSYLAKMDLDENSIYRIDRWDVESSVPCQGSIEQQLDYCDNNIIRVNRRKGTEPWPSSPHDNDIQTSASSEAPASKESCEFVEKPASGETYNSAETSASNEISESAAGDPPVTTTIEASHSDTDEEPPAAVPAPPEALVKSPVHAQTLIALRHSWHWYHMLVPAHNRNFMRRFLPDQAMSTLKLALAKQIDTGSGSSCKTIAYSPLRAKMLIALHHLWHWYHRFIPAGTRNLVRHFVPSRVSNKLATTLSEPPRQPNTGEQQASPALPQPPPYVWPDLHFNGCGDFTLMSAEWWHRLNGYSEEPIFSFHLDSILCAAAYYAGVKEVTLEDPMRIYHIEHLSGWTPEGNDEMFDSLKHKGIPHISDLTETLRQLSLLTGPAFYGHRDWGFPHDPLPITFINSPEPLISGPPSKFGNTMHPVPLPAIITRDGEPPLTIFTVPKRFTGYWDIIQKNALNSWLQAAPGAEILLMTPESDATGVADELGIKHISDIECNEFGTPMLDSIFKMAYKQARGQALMYVNTDIIFANKIDHLMQFVGDSPTLVSGLRHSIQLLRPLNFARDDWKLPVIDAFEITKKHEHLGSDYFLFSRGLYTDIPPFAIGRTVFDCWLLYEAYRAGARVIDATESIVAGHQKHDYSHHPLGAEGVWNGVESRTNQNLLDDPRIAYFSVLQADFKLGADGLQPVIRGGDHQKHYAELMSFARPNPAYARV